MNPANEERDPFDEVAESFLERYRAGERPSLTEYVQRYPHLEDQIRDLLPALVAVERGSPKWQEPRPHTPPVPERLGGYRILRTIGQGGMGVVYEAEQEALGRHVALKVLPFARLLEPTFRERFQREAQAAARLHHGNIVPVFGVGEEGGLHFYAMQYIQGQGLDLVLREVKRSRQDQTTRLALEQPPSEFAISVARDLISGRFAAPERPTQEDSNRIGPRSATGAASDRRTLSGGSTTAYYRSAARVAVQVAEALAYAHQHGILHRDIKPSNLLLDAHGTVWITDFGLAKVEGSADLTQPGDVLGTICYMAPERFQGISDRRSDVYGLGMTLYELLALRPAFQDSDRHRLMLRLAHEEPAPLRRWDRQIPCDLETIVLKAIAREPAHRYQTAGELAEDLRRFLADQPIRARRTSLAERVWRWCRRNPVVAGLSVVVAVLLLVLGAALLVTSLLRQERDKAILNQERAERAEQEVKIFSHLGQAMALRRSGAGGQRFKCLDEINQALQLNPSEKLRHQLRIEAIGALALPDLYLARQWPGFPPGSVTVDFDERLELYARTDQEGNCSIRQVVGDSEIVRLPGRGKPAKPTLSRNGRFVAVLGGGRLQVWSLVGSRSEPLLEESAHPVSSVDFRADNRWLALAHQDGAITVFELPTGRLLYRLQPTRLRRQSAVALHPTEPRIAVVSYFDHGVQLRDLVTGDVQAEVDRPHGFVHAAWSPDGRTLAVGGGNEPRVFLYDQQLEPVGQLVTRTGGMSAAFNHVGDRLVTVGWTGSVQLWDFVTRRLLFTLPGNLGVPVLRFSPDDQWLAGAISGTELGIWKVGAGRDFRTLVRHNLPEDVHFYSAAVGGKQQQLLAVAMSDGVGFWNLDTGAELHVLRRPGVVNQVLFEPSGTLLTLEEDTGVSRWVVPEDFARPDGLRLEPAQKLPFPRGGCAISRSRDGRVLALAVRNTIGNEKRAGVWVLHADRPESASRLDGQNDAAHVAVSADGRWIAAAPHLDDSLGIWEAQSGRLVRRLKQGGGRAFCQFSPNGQWLATGLDGNRLWAIDREPWTEGARVRPGDAVDPVFSPDGRLIAHDSNSGTIRLVAAASGEEILQLPDPHLDSAIPLFTPDGTRLLTLTNGTVPYIHIWDLRSIRQELATLGLDWKPEPEKKEKMRGRVRGRRTPW